MQRCILWKTQGLVEFHVLQMQILSTASDGFLKKEGFCNDNDVHVLLVHVLLLLLLLLFVCAV